MRTKPVVYYKGGYAIFCGRAVLHPLDHPDTVNVSNTKQVITSRVLSHDPVSGRVETQNSVYIPQLKIGYSAITPEVV